MSGPHSIKLCITIERNRSPPRTAAQEYRSILLKNKEKMKQYFGHEALLKTQLEGLSNSIEHSKGIRDSLNNYENLSRQDKFFHKRAEALKPGTSANRARDQKRLLTNIEIKKRSHFHDSNMTKDHSPSLSKAKAPKKESMVRTSFVKQDRFRHSEFDRALKDIEEWLDKREMNMENNHPNKGRHHSFVEKSNPLEPKRMKLNMLLS